MLFSVWDDSFRNKMDSIQFPICFFTGAGISQSAGIPTFRGKNGIWDEYDWQDYACQTAYDEDPEKVWNFHMHRRKLCRPARPTSAHKLIAKLEETYPGCVAVVTQNIDGLHRMAGSKNLIELHGNVWYSHCQCSDEPIEDNNELYCTECNSNRRPLITWFGDSLDTQHMLDADEAGELSRTVISIGTSSLIHPAVSILKSSLEGSYSIEINPEPTPISHLFNKVIRATADEGLEELKNILFG